MKQTKYLTVDEVSEILNISRNSIYTRISRGDFPIRRVKLGRLVRFPEDEVIRYLESLPRIGAGAALSD